MSPAGVPAQLDVSIESKSYRAASGGRLDVLRGLKFALPAGAVAALVGPSGCGKTTLLRIITGLDRDYSGVVSLPDHGKLGMVFQEPRLLPWRSVEQNVRLGAPEATDAELDVLFERRFAYQKTYAATNMRAIVALAQQYEIPLASHDDTTEENVTDAIRDRVSVAEFPTTIEAARGLHRAGIGILMGAPNVVRGGSHSGNIAAVDLAREGLLDILSSDYIPSSLLMAALQLPQRVPAIDLASAIRTVTKTPAEAVGLADRGEIAPGKRADLIRVHVARDVPVVRCVWREGHRVA